MNRGYTRNNYLKILSKRDRYIDNLKLKYLVEIY